MNTNTSNDPFLHNYNEDTHGGENHPPPPSHTSFSVSDTLNGALKRMQCEGEGEREEGDGEERQNKCLFICSLAIIGCVWSGVPAPYSL